MTKLHIFDLDGTLLRSTASIEISKVSGNMALAEEIEKNWLLGQITNLQFWQLCRPIWADTTEADIDHAFLHAPWIVAVEHVLDDIERNGERSVVISQSPEFFVKRLKSWGAHAAYGNGIEIGIEPTESMLLGADDKVTIVKDLLEQYSLGENDCVAYGDSTSDIPLFRWLPHTVAMNASPEVRHLAAAHYDGLDLREAYEIGRALITGRVAPGSPPAPR